MPRKKIFDTKFQYAMSREKHSLFKEKLRQKGLSINVFVRQHINRIEQVNSHVNLSYCQKKALDEHLRKVGSTYQSFMDYLADKVINDELNDLV